ncbi:MAG: hypothetical protein N3E45_16410 [Oscillatoriaceae bacterium SKW80]|nr:hypothetical protein [Oscillatoriaceae bacterium SKYG93]MCX8122381.1 hypothetical protein [Oscillatoriaceae bacterium SKW80]MDW8452694.1 hypothetical protein [Oscillatoriaceae cyanobacterium SKYGB_i_bin93]HIK27981.1 hypothetical protein [Oscillatoriaceae cyanobacterium M7585_C2015_266]
MSEELQQMSAEILPEVNAGVSIPNNCETETNDQKQQEENGDDTQMKALAKAIVVNLVWTMAGLLDKK